MYPISPGAPVPSGVFDHTSRLKCILLLSVRYLWHCRSMERAVLCCITIVTIALLPVAHSQLLVVVAVPAVLLELLVLRQSLVVVAELLVRQRAVH